MLLSNWKTSGYVKCMGPAAYDKSTDGIMQASRLVELHTVPNFYVIKLLLFHQNNIILHKYCDKYYNITNLMLLNLQQ